VAAYVALPGEPDTAPLLSALQAREITVLTPLMQPDRRLRWVAHRPGREQWSERASREPPARVADEPLLSTASVVICPGVAGDRQGHRLGRGGGSYDRALADVGGLRCLLLFDDEVIDAVPTEPHDQPVDVIVTPSGTLRVKPR
jgi:5-formyltetrahydrofolate cyclo-ligase